MAPCGTVVFGGSHSVRILQKPKAMTAKGYCPKLAAAQRLGEEPSPKVGHSRNLTLPTTTNSAFSLSSPGNKVAEMICQNPQSNLKDVKNDVHLPNMCNSFLWQTESCFTQLMEIA